MSSTYNDLTVSTRRSARALATRLRSRVTSPTAQAVTATFGTRVFLIGVAGVMSIVVTRIMGPELRGVYALAMSVVMIGTQFADLGVQGSNTYHVAKNPRLARALCANLLLIALVAGGLLAPAVYAVFAYCGYSPLSGQIQVLALLLIPVGMVGTNLQQLVLGIGELRLYNVANVATSVVPLLLIPLLIVADQVAPPALLVVSLVAQGMVAGWLLRLLLVRPGTRFAPDMRLLTKCFRYGVKTYMAGILSMLVLRLDLLMIKYLVVAKDADSQVGFYAVAVSIVGLMYLLPTTVGTVIFPRLCALDDRRARASLMIQAVGGVALLMVPLCAACMFYVRPLVCFMFGSQYEQAAVPLFWLIPGVFVWSLESVARKFLTSDGYHPVVIVAWGIAAALNVALNIWLLPKLGIAGAAIASSVALSTVAIITGPVIWRNAKAE